MNSAVATAQDTRTTLSSSLQQAIGSHQGVAARFPQGDGWETISYAQLGRRAHQLTKGLIALGVAPGDRVAILSSTRIEWTLADLAVLWAGGVVVPVYPSNSPAECRHVLADSGAKILFVEDDDQLTKLEAIRDQIPNLDAVVAFTEASPPAISLDQLAAAGARIPDELVQGRVRTPEPDDACTLVYTSGTTGAPKGCVLTHANLRANLDMIHQRIEFEPGESTIYLWLPLAHVLGRVVQLAALDQGATVAYWRRDPGRLLDDVTELAPTHLPSVPRVFEKIHAAATARAQQHPLKRRLLRRAIAVGRRHQLAREADGSGFLLDLQHAIADRLVLSRIRQLFGNRLQLAVTGAAPVDPEILRFFHAAGLYVLEGYGMTETTAVTSVNTVDEYRFGTVGKPLPGCEVRIAEDGELLVRGPHIFAGYWGEEEKTVEVLRDGWLATGDLASIDEDGFLSITGRKKDLIITSSGKNVTPASIEQALEQERWISHAVVYGDRRPYLTALITLDPEQAPALAAELGLPVDLPRMASDERVHRQIDQAVDRVNQGFAPVEQIKRFVLLERDLSEKAGELTPTAKVKRQAVYDRHRQRLDALYSAS